MSTGDWTVDYANCKKCGKPKYYIGDVPEGGFIKGTEPYCTCPADVNYYQTMPGNYGWICPTCRNVYSPYVNKCPSCPQGYSSTTWNTEGVIYTTNVTGLDVKIEGEQNVKKTRNKRKSS